MKGDKIRVKGKIIETQFMGFYGILDSKHKIPILLDPNVFKFWKGKKVKAIMNER